jgi:hypothetical protein
MPVAVARPLHSWPGMAIQTAAASGDDAHGRLYQEAVVFAYEFARLGYSATRLMQLFADPFYTTAFVALRRLGEPTVRAIVAEAVRTRPTRPRPAR